MVPTCWKNCAWTPKRSSWADAIHCRGKYHCRRKSSLWRNYVFNLVSTSVRGNKTKWLRPLLISLFWFCHWTLLLCRVPTSHSCHSVQWFYTSYQLEEKNGTPYLRHFREFASARARIAIWQKIVGIHSWYRQLGFSRDARRWNSYIETLGHGTESPASICKDKRES